MRLRFLVVGCALLFAATLSRPGQLQAQLQGQALFAPLADPVEALHPGEQLTFGSARKEALNRPYRLSVDGEPGSATLGFLVGGAVGYVIAQRQRYPMPILFGALMGSILFYQVGIG